IIALTGFPPPSQWVGDGMVAAIFEPCGGFIFFPCMLRLGFAQYVCVTSKHFEQKGQQLRRKRWPSHQLYRFSWGRRDAEKFIWSEVDLKPDQDSAAEAHPEKYEAIFGMRVKMHRQGISKVSS